MHTFTPDSCEHNPDFECFDCADLRHGREHPSVVAGCLTCKLQSLVVSPRVKGHGLIPDRDGKPPPKSALSRNHNSWEKGTAKDERGVPLLDQNGPIPVKRYGENRHKFDARRKELASSPTPFPSTS